MTDRRSLTQRLPGISSLNSLCDFVREHHAPETPVFVRTSTGIPNDREMGCSLDRMTGRREPGMCVNVLVWEGRDPGDRYAVARGVLDYYKGGDHWWRGYPSYYLVSYLVTGEVAGRGGDGEPALRPGTWQPLAILSRTGTLLGECLDAVDEASALARQMREDGVRYDCGKEFLHGDTMASFGVETCDAPCLHGGERAGCWRAWITRHEAEGADSGDTPKARTSTSRRRIGYVLADRPLDIERYLAERQRMEDRHQLTQRLDDRRSRDQRDEPGEGEGEDQ